MKTTELNELEVQINHLIQAVEQLKSENISLRHKLASCSRERLELQKQIQSANIQVKKVISQLKEELS